MQGFDDLLQLVLARLDRATAVITHLVIPPGGIHDLVKERADVVAPLIDRHIST
ncbi:hypothetical protein [Synechococcus sp. CS-205]|uniref:hypothetical protein n=1 Tax=Synechococcus sp. CS-205 TaxID=2847984 RepID=UPI00223AABFF|nr:hypothetical protein [Synechococcus sp. CS-205]